MAIGSEFVGELAALLAAFFWAAASLMFGRLGRQISPVVLNLVKGVFAIAFILITLIIQSTWQSTGLDSEPLATESTLPTRSLLYLIISGGLGIGLGDTAYFAAINALGTRRALLLETLAPPMAAVLAWIFLAEQLSWVATSGILVTLIGIAWVVSEQVPGTEKVSPGPGILIALVATFCQATGAVFSRAALADTAVSPLWSSLIRLAAGLAFMGGLVAIRPQLIESKSLANPASEPQPSRWRSVLTTLKSPRLLSKIAGVSFFATYLGIWLQQISLKYTAAGIAQALLATSPLFVLPMAAILGDRITPRSVLGVAITLSGVWLLLSVS